MGGDDKLIIFFNWALTIKKKTMLVWYDAFPLEESQRALTWASMLHCIRAPRCFIHVQFCHLVLGNIPWKRPLILNRFGT